MVEKVGAPGGAVEAFGAMSKLKATHVRISPPTVTLTFITFSSGGQIGFSLHSSTAPSVLRINKAVAGLNRPTYDSFSCSYFLTRHFVLRAAIYFLSGRIEFYQAVGFYFERFSHSQSHP